MRRRRRIDVLADRRRADEAHRVDPRIRQKGVHRLLVAVDHVEHALGRSGFHQQLGQAQRHRRILLRRLQHEGVPARSEEHTSELQSLMRLSYAVFCLKKTKHYTYQHPKTNTTYTLEDI